MDQFVGPHMFSKMMWTQRGKAWPSITAQIQPSLSRKGQKHLILQGVQDCKEIE